MSQYQLQAHDERAFGNTHEARDGLLSTTGRAEGTLARPARLPRCTAPGRRSRGHSGEASEAA